MKTGRTLTALAEEIQRQYETKRDYVAPSKLLSMAVKDNHITLGGIDGWPLTAHAHAQIASKLQIPKQYYDRMLSESPELLQQNVNEWLHRSDDKRMLRTLDGNIRAVLSDRYCPLDNYDLAQAVLPSIQETQCEVVSCEITDTRMYIKAVTKRISTEIAKGDVVQAGIVVSNSEVGSGSIKVEPLVYRLVCLNGMISADHAMRRNHVGRRLDSDEEQNSRFYSTNTRRLDARAFFAKVRDTVHGVLSEEGFGEIVRGMRQLKDYRIAESTDPRQMIEDVTKKLNLSSGEEGGVLQHLIKGGDLSAYGVMNAVTRASQDVESYDRATELERFGGMMCGWNVADWKTVGLVR